MDPGFSALYTPNSAMHTSFVQVNLKPGHLIGSYEYIDRVKRRMAAELPELTAFFSSGSLNSSFNSFAVGLTLSVLLLYLILVAQFRSFMDPILILLAFPPGVSGVIRMLWLTDTTLNVMSLMGVVMLAGITMSNSILIVEFAHHMWQDGMTVRDAAITSCRVRLRPVLMTTLATIIGLLPMALKLGEGSESYVPPARALVGGLTASCLVTVFIVPAGFYLAYRNAAARSLSILVFERNRFRWSQLGTDPRA